ncbi:MAG: hypothetical protein GW805_08880 [Ignavibacteria bacterium]|nr:hypothetical protein [Ignavibacteria bacterium]
MPLKNELNNELGSVSTGRNTSSFSSLTQVNEKKSNFSGNLVRGVLFGAFLFSFLMFIISQIDNENNNEFANNETTVISNGIAADFGGSSLIREMGAWMERMGYGKLSVERLKELRNKGVTATFTSKIRDLGYEPTLEDLVLLQNHDVSATFASMMHSLGYTSLTLADLIRLRTHEVTAHYTSNLHDLGYKEITADDLIRLKDAQVSISMVKKLNKNRLQLATIDELVRYGISNQ